MKDSIAPSAVLYNWLDALPLRRQIVAFVTSRAQGAYLVGGTVRDLLLGRSSCDLDIAVDGEAMLLARRLADQLGAAFVPLDAERDVARVVIRVGATQHHVDIARLRAQDIEGDLRARDYTINAMAVSLQGDLGALLDPTGGQADLTARRLRVASATAFEDDPLRILRGVRLSVSLGMSLAPETESLARAHVCALSRVSAERVRDELWLILASGRAAQGLALADRLGAWQVLLPEIAQDAAALSQGLNTLGALEASGDRWIMSDDVAPTHDQAAASALARYRTALHLHWTEELSSGRGRWAALKWVAFLSVSADMVTMREVAQHLRLSAREVEFMGKTRAALDDLSRWTIGSAPAPLEIYRYFRAVGAAGVDAAVLALITPQGKSHKDTQPLAGVERLLEAWFDQHDSLVDPPQLVTGDDLVHLLYLRPGPALGRLLEAVREAQVQGTVHTREQALCFARERARSEQAT